MLVGEDAVRHAARKQLVAEHLAGVSADYHRDPSYVRMLVFSGRRGLLAAIPPQTTASRPAREVPQTPVAEIREGQVVHHASRDGEMFMVPLLRNIVAAYVAEMQQNAPAPQDEVRVEFMGPRGTCANCAEALRALAGAYQGVIDQTLGPGVLRLSMITRWTGPQQEWGPMGTRYGTTNAARSAGPKIDDQNRWYAPHWKRARH